MGATDPQLTIWSLEQLAASPVIALVRPDAPELRIEEHTTSGVAYRLGFDRYVVERWLKGTGPERIEVASASNEASMRDARDQANGLLGHVEHVVPVHQLDAALAPHAASSGPRIVFLEPVAQRPYREVAPGLALALGLAERFGRR